MQTYRFNKNTNFINERKDVKTSWTVDHSPHAICQVDFPSTLVEQRVEKPSSMQQRADLGFHFQAHLVGLVYVLWHSYACVAGAKYWQLFTSISSIVEMCLSNSITWLKKNRHLPTRLPYSKYKTIGIIPVP